MNKKNIALSFIIVMLIFSSCFINKNRGGKNGLNGNAYIIGDKYRPIFENEKTYSDTSLIRYFGDQTVVARYKDKIDQIYKETTTLFDHNPNLYKRNDDLFAVYIVDADEYKDIYPEENLRACFESGMGLILPYRNNSRIRDTTVRHELIHAVTTGSPMAKCKNVRTWYAEGIAQALQDEKVDNRKTLRADFSEKNLNTDFLVQNRWTTDISLKYLQSAALMQCLLNKYSFESVINVFYEDMSFDSALKKDLNLTGSDVKELYLNYIAEKMESSYSISLSGVVL